MSGAFSFGEDRPALRNVSGIDWGLLVATLALALIGLATVRSASAELDGDHLARQALWVGLGVVVMAAAALFNHRTLMEFALPIYLGGVSLLVAVLLFGRVAGGARSWLGYAGLGVQPAEVAKLTTAIWLAGYLAGVDRRTLGLREILVAGAIVALPIGLIAWQPDYGSAAMFVPIVAGMTLVAGIPRRLLVGGLVTALLLGAGLWSFALQDYQRQRIETFVNPAADPLGAGYQVQQSKIAVGSGELTGQGYMQGTQSQLRFLPARHTDFVFAVLAEEWGFLGTLTVLGLYAVWIVNAFRVALRAREREGVLLIVGLVSLFSFHVLYNTAMVVGFVPITGIPLPFLSYGGSFTMLNFAITGLILGIDARRYVNA